MEKRYTMATEFVAREKANLARKEATKKLVTMELNDSQRVAENQRSWNSLRDQAVSIDRHFTHA